MASSTLSEDRTNAPERACMWTPRVGWPRATLTCRLPEPLCEWARPEIVARSRLILVSTWLQRRQRDHRKGAPLMSGTHARPVLASYRDAVTELIKAGEPVEAGEDAIDEGDDLSRGEKSSLWLFAFSQRVHPSTLQ